VPAAAPSLLELQRAMRASLVARDSGLCARVVEGDIDAGERLGIYRNTFASTLTRALSLSYPAVRRLVGAEFFEGAARIFIEAHPPTSACLDDYGEGWPGFLSGFEPAGSLAYLPDVARLEWSVSRALHAPDAAPLDSRSLEVLAESERAQACFVPHPSLSHLRADYPADLLWRAVLEDDDAALARLDPGPDPVWLLVQRLPAGVEVRRMTEPAWRFGSALCAGQPLAAALDDARAFDASALLADYLVSGRFTDFFLAQSST
jgi:putative DNA-binding protein